MIEVALAASGVASDALGSGGIDWVPSAKDWLLLAIGALLGIALNLFFMAFPDLAHRLPFLYPKHSAKLQGKATLLHHLTAKAGDPAKAQNIDLSNSFRHPGNFDGTEWEVSNLVLRTRWNHDALLTCNLAWQNNSKKWIATVTGKGRYFGQNFDDFDGYIYVVCDCEGISGATTIHWKVVYELRRKPDPTEGWDGYWLMFDAQDRTHSKFGLIDLQY